MISWKHESEDHTLQEALLNADSGVCNGLESNDNTKGEDTVTP